MHTRLIAAALAALLLVLGPAPADADVIEFRDGSREESRGNVSLAYDTVELGRRKFDAALVKTVYTDDTDKNSDFQAGELYGQRGYWNEAAESFRAAAANLKGASKELALHKRLLSLMAANDVEASFQASTELLAEFPKTFFYGPTQEVRARILASQGKMPDAVNALKQVTAASGMNARDYYNAEYLRVWLTRVVGASTPQDHAAAEKELRAVLQDLERNRNKQYANEPRLKILISLAVSLQAQAKSDEAKTLFNQVLAAADAQTDRSILATLYNGLGDLAFEEAAGLQKSGADKAQVKALLENAALHYLRVNLLYPNHAGQRELYGAAVGAARVFGSLFQLTNDKDCDLARRAYEYYVRASRMQERGEEKRLLLAEGRAFKKRLDAACQTEGAAPTDESEREGGR